MKVSITTERLHLHDFKPSHREHYVAMVGAEGYDRFYDDADCEPEFSRQLVEKFISDSSVANRKNYQLAIENVANQQFMGTVGLRLQQDGSASFGLGLHPNFHGKGYAAEAASAVIAFGFKELGIHKIFAETLLENEAAARLCKNLGMREDPARLPQQFFKNKNWQPVRLSLIRTR